MGEKPSHEESGGIGCFKIKEGSQHFNQLELSEMCFHLFRFSTFSGATRIQKSYDADLLRELRETTNDQYLVGVCIVTRECQSNMLGAYVCDFHFWMLLLRSRKISKRKVILYPESTLSQGNLGCRTVGNSYNYPQHSAGAKIHMGQVCLTIPLPVLFRCGFSPNYVEGINFMKGKTEFFRCFCVEDGTGLSTRLLFMFNLPVRNLASRHRVSIRGRIFGSFWRKSSAKVVPQVLSLSILRIFQTTFLKGFSWWRH